MSKISASWILLRHGESVGNRERWLAGSTDTPLTEKGRAQARTAGAQLADTALERALASTLVRAQDTARLALKGRDTPLSFYADLCERELGSWATRKIEDVRAEVGDRIWSWDEPPPEGEAGGHVAARALGCLRDVPRVAGTTLVVAHGGVIRSLLGLVEDLPYAVIGQRKVPNAVPIPVQLGAGGWAAVWDRHAAELERFRP